MYKNYLKNVYLSVLLTFVGCQLDKTLLTEDIPQGNFIGKICDENGNPVNDAAVYLIPEDYSILSDNKILPDSTRSNSTGIFGFEVHRSGKYNLLASSTNRYAFKKSIPVSAESRLELPEQRLSEAGSVVSF